jgi:hypothetical protein
MQQLKMPFLVADAPESQPACDPTQPNQPVTAWEALDETARIAALGVLARLIARMLAAAPGKEGRHE